MGVDLGVITGHNYNYEQIIELQDRIESDKPLRELFWWNPEPVVPWQTLMTEEQLHGFWEHNEKQEEVNGVFFHYDLDLPTFFGYITFHRNIVTLYGFGSRLWSMSDRDSFRQNILNFYNRLAQILNQNHVIYFGDSWAKSSWIDDWVYGKTLNDIREQITLKGLGSITEVVRSVNEDHLYIQHVKPTHFDSNPPDLT